MDYLSGTGALYARPQRAQGFWQRQFDDAPTPAQRKFDVMFGIIMPLVCFVFDPVVFKGGVIDDMGLYQQYQLYAYTISALEMVALCAWLLPAGRAASRPAVLTGMLFAGALFSFGVGLSILPYSFFGLLVIVGVLGFVPFLTAFVYLRNGCRAADAVGLADGRTAFALGCGFAFALGAPAVTHVPGVGEALGQVWQSLVY